MDGSLPGVCPFSYVWGNYTKKCFISCVHTVCKKDELYALDCFVVPEGLPRNDKRPYVSSSILSTLNILMTEWFVTCTL